MAVQRAAQRAATPLVLLLVLLAPLAATAARTLTQCTSSATAQSSSSSQVGAPLLPSCSTMPSTELRLLNFPHQVALSMPPPHPLQDAVATAVGKAFADCSSCPCDAQASAGATAVANAVAEAIANVQAR